MKKRVKKSTAGTRQLHGLVLDDGLTPQQEAYCRARAMGMPSIEALGSIGSPVNLSTAQSWERTIPMIRTRIGELSELANKSAILKTGLDREWVISRYMTVVERCMQAEPVVINGKPTGQYKFDSAGANAALRSLGDTLQMFKPAEKKVGDEYAELSDADITRIVEELASQTGAITFAPSVEATAGSQQIIEVQAVSKAD